MSRIKVYLKGRYGGEVVSHELIRDEDGEPVKLMVDHPEQPGRKIWKGKDYLKEIEILKVFADVHEPTSTVLAFYVKATPEQRDNLWSAGLACSREQAMGLVSQQRAAGEQPVGPPEFEDSIPQSHRMHEVEAADDDHGSPSVLNESPPVAPPEPSADPDAIESHIELMPAVAAALERAGISTVQDLAGKSQDDLTAIKGVGVASAAKLLEIAPPADDAESLIVESP